MYLNHLGITGIFDILISQSLVTKSLEGSYNMRDVQSQRDGEQENIILQQPSKEGMHLGVRKRVKASHVFFSLLWCWLLDFTLKSYRIKSTVNRVQILFLPPDPSHTLYHDFSTSRS